jgi:transposase-like protein
VLEQEHHIIKPIGKPMMGFKWFNTARRTLRGIEAMNIIRKGQVQGVRKGDVQAQRAFMSQIFDLVASLSLE